MFTLSSAASYLSKKFMPNSSIGVSAATDLHEREKDFLNEAELEKLFEAAKKSRHGSF